MISDEDVKLLFRNTWRIQSKHFDPKKPMRTQFFRGVDPLTWEGQYPNACMRHIAVFKKYNIVPKYCFDCYKVVIEPRTVVELFKLMMVIEKLDLRNDNTRKCMVETRKQVSGAYKGLIYCRSIEEGKEISGIVQKIMSVEISGNIPVSLKRGCSEYADAYPEYAQINQGVAVMNYKEEWQEYETLAEQQLVVNPLTPVNREHEPQTYTAEDAIAMLGWLKYAATIGDESYLKICWRLSPFPKLERPSPFHPVDDK